MTVSTVSPSASARDWGCPGPAADGRPRYVTDINAETGTVTVGRQDDLRIGHITADRLKRLDPAKYGETFECEVQVRAHGGVVPATATLTGAASDGPEAAVEWNCMSRCAASP